MKTVYFGVVLVLCCYSCKNFVLKKDQKEDILKEEWNNIDTHAVEEPPLFENCNTGIASELELCFQKTIIEHVQQVVSQRTIVVQDDVKDTLWLPIHIDKEGVITITDYTLPKVLEAQFPEFKEVLMTQMATLPKAKAAHSRGVSVATQYRLPIVLRSE